MGRRDDFDEEFEGQITIADAFSPPERMIAVSNVFARARKQMSLAEQKVFVFALSKIDWAKEPDEQSPVVKLDKKMLASVLGYKSDSTDLSQNLWSAIRDLAKHSYISIADRDKGIYESGAVISRISMRKNVRYVRIRFEQEFFPLFSGLSRDYITMWSSDIFQMTSRRSVLFYELLRQLSFDKYEVGSNVYSYGMGVRAIKQAFDIPEEAYMRSKGGFNRSEFERRVLDPLGEDLAKCRMIKMIVQPDGRFYEKVKRGNRVIGYRFFWTFSAYPAVADGDEVRKIAERVDKDPEVLKVARDILSGEEKRKKKDKSPAGAFANFEQREYDYTELERQLLQAQDMDG